MVADTMQQHYVQKFNRKLYQNINDCKLAPDPFPNPTCMTIQRLVRAKSDLITLCHIFVHQQAKSSPVRYGLDLLENGLLEPFPSDVVHFRLCSVSFRYGR